ncbi:MAG: PA0069 family radical SAM protein [Phaeodactylibacter xiamenensis]|uniref:Radical SAM protein n=1 Tax=Phaeodactylibacter xiamenensis TaxID=1524460 RepID=A0A098S1A8_9BACT|nr:PA0069 family radical SAM protein [Phaeodactylibacter xiamenensis]KGE85836.1 radical SAM protein [Phaeodactylibacter xiamenensis]MCR9053240.1 PA0069 family radical SAM protein [bacterium]
MSSQPAKYNQGRGAQINPANRFHEHDYGLEPLQPDARTQYIPVYPKTILNRVESPDIGMAWSMNPYQGCEHGCIYCYARNTHNYWGYSAGLDFEQKVLYKKDAPQLLEQQLKKKNWKPEPIMLAGNTDCYQPAEQTLGITREILKVLWKYRHPVGIITKNSMVLRDLDLLQPMAENRLLRVSISLTTLNEKLRRLLEPRTASVKARLKTIEVLAEKGIPVNVMMAPIIPGLNDHEILEMGQRVSSLGAVSMTYTMVRLNGDVAAIFEDWIRKTMPDRADRVLNRIRDVHGGELNDSRFGTRMRGEGQFAEVVKQQFQLARQRYFADKVKPDYNLDLFEQGRNPQMSLF